MAHLYRELGIGSEPLDSMTNQPLLVLSEQRLQHEVQRALAAAAATHYQLVRKRWLIAACLLEYVGGLTLIGTWLPNKRSRLAAPGSQGRIPFVTDNLVCRSLSAIR